RKNRLNATFNRQGAISMVHAVRRVIFRLFCASPIPVLAVVFTMALNSDVQAQHGKDPRLQISTYNWGRVTTPVFGTSESGVYADAELWAGLNKLGSYLRGVLPKGRIVPPAGVSVQVGMNPLGVVVTPDGKYLVTSNDDERAGTLSSVQNST